MDFLLIWTIIMHSKLKTCRICGFEYDDFYPWGEDGNTASFEICDCCGVTFGYEDATNGAINKFRKEWIDNGAKWSDISCKPSEWTLQKALSNIPKEYKDDI